MVSGKSPAAKLSATVLMLRDAASGCEVFMVQRHHQIEFAKGALVFPGGKVDAADRDPALRGRCAGLEGLDDDGVALRVAAIRETFEETGVLLARSPGELEVLPQRRVAEIEARHRETLLEDRISLGEIAEREDLELACELLVPFAHWITPERAPKRFDTYFFLAPAPPDQAAAHDGSEAVDSLWIRPADALAEGDAGRRTVVFPTRLNLQKLARSSSVAEALERARREPVVTVLPRVEVRDTGPVVRIPEEAGYDLSEAPLGPEF
jgi:8-oxo-dGTP pyrophosphatase MutT (NUDIX family)